MQTPKETVRNEILRAARSEFLKNGFERASVRTITANANTSKSNIYNYFSDKDALFCEVLKPVLTMITTGFEKIRVNNRQDHKPYTIETQEIIIRRFIRFVFENRDDFILLLFLSSGSSLSGFRNSVTEQLAEVMKDWIEDETAGRQFPDLFIRSVAGFYIGVIERILIEGKTKEQTENNMNIYLQFIYGGWNQVFSISDKSEKE